MISDRQTPDDLENLSALFDGELDGDAARFVQRRLGHDAGWQRACGRWQLIGDALRGQATAAAPADFADRVAAAVAVEPALVVGPVSDPRVAPSRMLPAARKLSRGWIGGALAASMALVAVFAVRSPEPQPAVDRPIAVEPAAAVEPASVASPVPAAVPMAPPAVETPGIRRIAAAAPTPAPARLVPRVDEQAARESTARIARAVQRQAAGLAVQDEAAPAVLADTAPDPFRPRTDIVTRPWPRAVLPNSQAAGALTASFEAPAPSSRSRPFYPFEPPSQGDAAVSQMPRP